MDTEQYFIQYPFKKISFEVSCCTLWPASPKNFAAVSPAMPPPMIATWRGVLVAGSPFSTMSRSSVQSVSWRQSYKGSPMSPVTVQANTTTPMRSRGTEGEPEKNFNRSHGYSEICLWAEMKVYRLRKWRHMCLDAQRQIQNLTKQGEK